MKNLHILPTDKPSRLTKVIDHRIEEFRFNSDFYQKIKFTETNQEYLPQNIYITSDEEIKVGDWMIRANEQPIKVTKDFFWDFGVRYYKITLTTDQSLDGVQAIDNEFLEWFVKNPSCEEVKINTLLHKNYFGFDKDLRIYKIIIPKEEPKERLKKVLGLKHPKQETLSTKLHIGEVVDDSYPEAFRKQETLEEAAERFVEAKQFRTEEKDKSRRYCFIQGAKWQQEQDRWKTVFEETPPSNIELLAESPDGTVHLTGWRAGYQIFSCQAKSESSDGWKWKTI
jgi:hypothetical protein